VLALLGQNIEASWRYVKGIKALGISVLGAHLCLLRSYLHAPAPACSPCTWSLAAHPAWYLNAAYQFHTIIKPGQQAACTCCFVSPAPISGSGIVWGLVTACSYGQFYWGSGTNLERILTGRHHLGTDCILFTIVLFFGLCTALPGPITAPTPPPPSPFHLRIERQVHRVHKQYIVHKKKLTILYM
jgi:hypothetical protein